jgi:hypothetical protein
MLVCEEEFSAASLALNSSSPADALRENVVVTERTSSCNEII